MVGQETGQDKGSLGNPELQALIERERAYNSQFLKAKTMVLSDRPTEPVDTAFFFGRSWHDAERWGVYQLATDLYQGGLVKKIVIYGNEGQRFGEKDPEMLRSSDIFPKDRRANMVAPSREIAKARFVRMGVPDEDVILTQIPDPERNNTVEESMGFLIAAKDQGWTSAVVVANPHQLLREMLGLIALMDKQPGNLLDVYSAAPTSTDWGRRVRGAQGEHFAPREEHILLEDQRIGKYQHTGDLVSFERYFDYLRSRGQGR